MTVTLKLSPETERYLQERAAQSGQTLEAYLQQLVERAIGSANGSTETEYADQITPAEFERRLDALSEGLPSSSTLRAGWSRDDLYVDHD